MLKLSALGKPEDIPEIREWAEEFMQFIFTRSQEKIVENGTSDRGTLLRSGVPPYWEGNKISIRYDAPHAMPVEDGAVPHGVNPEWLEGWARRKLGLSDKEAKKAAGAIAWKIYHHGTKPQPFIRPVLQEAEAKYGLNAKFSES